MFSYDLELYDALQQKWFFVGNTRTVEGAKIYWQSYCIDGPHRAGRIIVVPTGKIAWASY